jgi:hypothetical protein
MSWLQRLFARKRMGIELDKELRFHFKSQVTDKVRSGLSESEARRLTRLEFGGIEQIKEDCRDSRGTLWVDAHPQEPAIPAEPARSHGHHGGDRRCRCNDNRRATRINPTQALRAE